MSYELKDTSQRSTIDMGHEGIITEIVQDTLPVMRSRPFGKLVVLMHSRLCTISLGPDYCLFVPTFLCFAVVGYFMTKFVYNTSENPLFRFITLAVCSVQPLAYLITALSDPGVVMQSVQQPDEPAREAQTHRLIKECKKCQLWVKHDTFHCSECQVCIQEYDHHCPWVSKCIGKKNLTAFYIFLGMTPAFIIYCMVAFFICASLSLTSGVGNQH